MHTLPPNTLVRLAPYTTMYVLRPSGWIRATVPTESNNGFIIQGDEHCFTHIHLTMSEELFAMLLSDVHMIGQYREGFQLFLQESLIY